MTLKGQFIVSDEKSYIIGKSCPECKYGVIYAAKPFGQFLKEVILKCTGCGVRITGNVE